MIFASVHKSCQHLSDSSPRRLNADWGSSFPTVAKLSYIHKGAMSTLEVTSALSPGLPTHLRTLEVSQNLCFQDTLAHLQHSAPLWLGWGTASFPVLSFCRGVHGQMWTDLLASTQPSASAIHLPKWTC